MHFEEDGSSVPELKEEFLAVLRESVREAAGDAHGGRLPERRHRQLDRRRHARRGHRRAGRTYSIGFEAEGYDEMEYARIAARHFGTEHHEYYVTPDDVRPRIPPVAAVLRPAVRQLVGGAGLLLRAAGAETTASTRLLAGDGGDELFGGNARYAKQRVFGCTSACRRRCARRVLEPCRVASRRGEHRRCCARRAATSSRRTCRCRTRCETYNLLRRLGPADVFTGDFLAAVDRGSAAAPASARSTAARDARSADQPHAGARLALHARRQRPAEGDAARASWPASRSRFPLLDDALVAFSRACRRDYKLKGTQLRWFFKEALRGFLPDEIITKKKHGFGLPFGVWLQQHAAAAAARARQPERPASSAASCAPEFIDELLGRHLPEHAGYYGDDGLGADDAGAVVPRPSQRITTTSRN